MKGAKASKGTKECRMQHERGVEVLARLADVLPDGVVDDVVDVAAQYAGDHHLDSHSLHGQEEEHSRLNRFRRDSGWPQMVRGKALLALAQVCRHHPNAAKAKLVTLIWLAIADQNPTVPGGT